MLASYSKDRNNPDQYNVRVVGAEAHNLEGQTIHVRTQGGTEKPETLGRRIWAGHDEQSCQPVALYAKGGYSAGGRGPTPSDAIASLERRVMVLERQVAELMGARAPRQAADRAARAESIAAMQRESAPAGSVDDDLPF